jgi:hypothetical protein
MPPSSWRRVAVHERNRTTDLLVANGIRVSTTGIGDCDCQVTPGDTGAFITVPSSAM